MKKYIIRSMYCCAVAFITLIPIVLSLLNIVGKRQFGTDFNFFNDPELGGVVAEISRPHYSLYSVLNVQYQSKFESWFANKLSGRKIFTRMYNQLIYSTFISKDNDAIIVGKDNYLFEIGYPINYLNEQVNTDLLNSQVARLSELNDLLCKNSKIFAVVISPSKARVYSDKLPYAYDRYIHMKENGEYELSFNERLIDSISQTGVPLFNPFGLYSSERSRGLIPFTVTSTHWSHDAKSEFFVQLNQFLGEQAGRKIGEVSIERESVYNAPTYDDRDLLDVLSTLDKNTPFYFPQVKLHVTNTDYVPAVFDVGGSFFHNMLYISYGNTKYGDGQYPIWTSATHSNYFGPVMEFIPEYAYTASQTTDLEKIANNDIIIVEINEGMSIDSLEQTHMKFVDAMITYLRS